jgi:cytoskeletal protein CcmA (bactofilin family)
MFQKFSQKPMSSTSEKFDTLIGRTTTIQGNLIVRDSLRIDGKVVGRENRQ